MRWRPSLAGIVGVAALFGAAPRAAAFDCTKAATVIEQTLCASPALMEQDGALSKAYADRLVQDPARAAALRTDQRAWLAQREKLCGAKAATPARVACLTGLYRARLTALAAGAAVPAPAATTAALPPPRPPAAVLGPPPAILGAPPAPALPDLPTRVPDPDATLSQERVAAAGRSDVLVEVRQPGRFSIRARSGSGVGLQLVDMIAGPGDEAGEPGVKDGRLDVLLDRGTYKLRLSGAAGAAGDAQLSILPFHEAAELANALVFGGEAETVLSDLGQRSSWIVVPAPGHVSFEAVGRALGDLRLWRNGTDLAALAPAIDRIAPRPGHPMTRARLEGDVEPGLYLATVYGGPRLAWTDGDKAEPLSVRTGAPEPLAGGWIEGVIGPIGSARFAGPDKASSFRLELPEPAAATLSVRHGTDEPSVEAILKNSREPVAVVTSPAAAGRVVEVTGTEGQPLRLRALDPSAPRTFEGPGAFWVGVDVAGEGGDEFPATVVLAQSHGSRGARVLASNAPQIGPGRAWRQKLNLRGKSTLLFEVTAPVQAGVIVTGVRADTAIDPLLGKTAPRTDGKAPSWTLEAGWYTLTLTPPGEAAGLIDLTLGPVGTAGELKPQPPRPSISLGRQVFERGGSYQILTNQTPTLVLAPYARPLPANLETEPFAVYQEAGQALDLPLKAPARGFLSARGVNGVPVAVQRLRETSEAGGQAVTLHVPAPERARGLVLSWSDPVPEGVALARPPAAAEIETVAAGKPRFFDLARDGEKSFALDVPTGGLYRVETLGRLQTAITLATAFLPKLDSASANGTGSNALAQSYLRAGRYTVSVKASESSGRVGLVARPAELPAGAPLVAGTSARASLADGRGIAFPIAIAEAGRYHLDLFALGKPLRARLEDEEGWPLTAPGPTSTIERRFEPGHYRLVVLPEPVDARAVVRLERVLPAPDVTGHGPHPLTFDKPTAFQWREPASTGQPRDPDRWTFALQGPADVTIDLTSGMTGRLLREGDGTSLGRIVAKSGFAGRLEAGRYIVEAQSQGRNDRLDYRITLASRELQPGVARQIELPATVPFAIAEGRVVNLTSFGRTDLRGVLKDAGGQVIERLDDRADDWNIALSRRLAAGAYTLELSAADPRPSKSDAATPDEATDDSADAPADDKDAATPPDDADQPDTADKGNDQDDASADASADDDSADTPDSADQPADKDTAASAEDKAEPDAAGKATSPAAKPDVAEAEADDTGIEVRLALPETADHPPLVAGTDAAVSGGEVHRFALAAAPAGRLMVVAARSAQDLVLSLERADGAGQWQVAGFERGKAPSVAVPSDGDAARPWRVSLWAVDGGPAAMTLGARAVERTAVAPGAVALQPVPFGDLAPDLRAALVQAPASGLLSLPSRPEGLLDGSLAGRALQPVTDRTLVPQADTMWLVSRGPQSGQVTVEPAAVPPSGLALTVPAEGRATVPASTLESGKVRVWRAVSTFGQPGLAGGHGFGVASGSALALGGDAPVTVWNAAGPASLALRLSAADLAVKPETRAEAGYAASLPAGAAQPVALAAGHKRVTLDLAAGTAAVLGSRDPASTTVWSGESAQSRTVEGDWTDVLLLNPSAGSQPVRVSLAPVAGAPEALAAGKADRRFFGAAGSLAMRASASPGDRLVVAGAAVTFIGDDGQVQRGTTLALTGPGEVILDHPPGLVAAWIERPGLSPWPAVQPQPVAPPAVLPLAGEAMALALNPPAAVLLHARTSAPVILSLARPGQPGQPEVYPAGAEFHRLLAAGEATLNLYAPQDGPLTGSLELTATPVTPAGEGVGEPVALAPGASALFAFEVRKRAPIGVGVRAEPDMIAVRLLDDAGRSLGSGVAQLQTLDPGRYLIEARVPADGRTTVVRPAVVGLAPPPSGPPPDVIAGYMQLVGLAPTAPTR